MKDIHLVHRINGNEVVFLTSDADAKRGVQVASADERQIFIQGDASSRFEFSIDPRLRYFYSDETLNAGGLPLAGTLQTNAEFWGTKKVSLFDVTVDGLGAGLRVSPQNPQQRWTLARRNDRLVLALSGAGRWEISVYEGNEPDWALHRFPFSNLPESDEVVRHSFIRGLLDFFGGTRRSARGVYYNMPNTNKGYDGDGIPDTFFQFMATYLYLSDVRRSYWRSHLEWLGENMRSDGAIPWGGVKQEKPYYHLWINEKYGLFFDANGLWLEMIYHLWHLGGVEPRLDWVIRAADFYLHYMTSDGLVAAESKKAGCEWADFLQNGWHSSLINVLAYRGLIVAARMLAGRKMNELADRYQGHAARLRDRLNRRVEEGGLWTGEGYADWRDNDGKFHPHWRMDTHMLAIVFGVPTNDQVKTIWENVDQHYFGDEPVVPAPYLLYGSWDSPEDDMLEGCRSFGCGRTSWMGRCGAPLAAALYRCGRNDKGERIFQKLVKMVNQEEGVCETYDENGQGSGNKSYIEHALSPLYAMTLKNLE